MNLILFFASAIGLMSIITTSTIMNPFRTWIHKHLPANIAQGIECSQCVGFWTGIIALAILDEPASKSSYWAMFIFLIPFTIAALCYAYAPRCSAICNFVLLFVAISASGIFNRPFWAIENLIHTILYGCAGSMASVLYINIITWLDANSMVDLGEDP